MPTTTTRSEALTRHDRATLIRLEDVLATARRWAMEEAKALLVIRNRRLYRATHQSFEAYAQERWGFEHSHAGRLCQWAEVLDQLSPFGDDVPRREAHARPMYGLAPQQQRDVWRTTLRRHRGRQTAADVEAVVGDVLRTKTHRRATQPPYGGRGEIVCGDAIEQVKRLAEGSVGLALFSPPYCEQRRGHYPGIPEADFPKWMRQLMAALRPAIRGDGNILIVGREHVRGGTITDAWLRARLAIREEGFYEIDTLVWNKPDSPPLGRADRPRRAFEFIHWFSTSTRPYIDTRACGTPMVESRSRMRRERNKNYDRASLDTAKARQTFYRFRTSDTARVTDVVTAAVGHGIPAGIPHPAMFPEKLADQLVRTYSRLDDLVVDPCCGSGTTLMAARNAGRRYWGCDLVAQYVELARRRIAGG